MSGIARPHKSNLLEVLSAHIFFSFLYWNNSVRLIGISFLQILGGAQGGQSSA
jgi:hypothetical protein